MTLVPPRPGKTTAVADGIDWLRFPHKSGPRNVWRFVTEDGWHLVDSGHGTSANEALWKKLLRDEAVTQLIVTDSEPGAVGNAEFVSETPVMMAEHHVRWAHYLAAIAPEIEHDLRTRFYRENGLSEADMRLAMRSERSYQAAVPHLPRRYQRITDGEVIAVGGIDWQVLGDEGPGGISLFAAEAHMLITGALDPAVAHVAFTQSDEDRLTPWLATLDRLARLPEGTLVLPARGTPLKTLHRQIDRLRRQVKTMGDRVAQACRDPVSAAGIATKLSHGRPIETAFGAAVALLNHLAASGRVERLRDHGVRFRAIG